MASKKNLSGIWICTFFLFLISCVSPEHSNELPEPDPELAEPELEIVPESNPALDPELQQSQPVPFVPTEVEYEQTFLQVEDIIESLNLLIRERRFEDWLGYLTPEYRAILSDAAFLAEASERPALKNRGVVLENLRDYFLYVVVPSRANLRLDELVFVRSDSVEAIMLIKDSPVTLYHLVLQNGVWKIGSF